MRAAGVRPASSQVLLGRAPVGRAVDVGSSSRATRLECQHRAALTKLDHEPCSSAEHAKLHLRHLSELGNEAPHLKHYISMLRDGLTNCLFEGPNCTLAFVDLLATSEAKSREREEEAQHLEREIEAVQASDPYNLFEAKDRTKRNMRRAEKLNLRQAKEVVNEYATLKAVLQVFTSVDLVTFLRMHLCRQPTGSDLVGTMAKLIKEKLQGKAHIVGGANKVAIGAVLSKVLQKWRQLAPETIQGPTEDVPLGPETLQESWGVLDRQYYFGGAEYDAMTEAMLCFQKTYKEQQARARRVIQAYCHKSGLDETQAEQSDESSEDEEKTASKATEFALKMKARKLAQTEADRDYYKGALEKARLHIDLLKSEIDDNNASIENEKAVMRNSISNSNHRASRLGVVDKIKTAFDDSNKLTTVNKQLMMQTEQYLEKIETLQEAVKVGTPRPNWEDPQMADWQMWLDMEGLTRSSFPSTKEYVTVLMQQTAGLLEEVQLLRRNAGLQNRAAAEVSKDSGQKKPVKFVQALGTGEDVPRYLRWKGRLRLRTIGKREAEVFVNQVWKDKISSTLDPPLSMEEHFYRWLRARFGSPMLAAEWAYNLVYALEAYKFDADCELFLAVLRGEMHEDVYHDQIAMLDVLEKEVEKVDFATSGHKSGEVEVQDLMQALAKVLPQKGDDDLAMIKAALARTVGEDLTRGDVKVAYGNVFRPDEELCDTPFIETIRDQHLHDIQEYVVELVEAVQLEVFEDTQDGRREKIGGTEAVKAILKVDPEKPNSKAEDLVRRCADVALDVEILGEDFLAAPFLKCMRCSFEKRSTLKGKNGAGSAMLASAVSPSTPII